jgi:hypothetical protein
MTEEVYQIRNKRTGKIEYVGSSSNLKRRIQTHKSMCKNKLYQYIRDNGGIETFEIISISKHETKTQARMEEQCQITQYDTFNTNKAYITEEQKIHYRKIYYQENKDRLLAYSKIYSQTHKEQSKLYRETHKEQSKLYRETHKEQIAERGKLYRETHKEQIAEYYQTHKEQIAERKKLYRETHKEQITERTKLYRETHKEQITERKLYIKNNPEIRREKEKKYRQTEKGKAVQKRKDEKRSVKIECLICKGSYCEKNKKAHFETKKHIKAQENQ